jgi:hypothetical protein
VYFGRYSPAEHAATIYEAEVYRTRECNILEDRHLHAVQFQGTVSETSNILPLKKNGKGRKRVRLKITILINCSMQETE